MKTRPAGGVRTQMEILEQEIHGSDEARYGHRLHGVLLVARGMSCRQAAALLGDSTRAVRYWVSNFERHGLEGLREGERAGCPPRLSDSQRKMAGQALRAAPATAGVAATRWNGQALSDYLRNKFGVNLGVRQCQRLLPALAGRSKAASTDT
ncbi:helix-turn-helix domain-containing protein [Paludibaculum fermentans]|uniref:Helix-turn-helix domain containing protein n=1 Tax=Paludibaculum fermentans TaxID=1473598 RepID=A0A7S7NV30_PALFE|nr:helix-turn-helix domain-containing protein [Paludibaculum fermentans]QOY90348.1 helix-turn-helix domain containing protein [Paludibaculum fermentans]